MASNHQRFSLHQQLLDAIEHVNVEGIKAIITMHDDEKGFTDLDFNEALTAACSRGNADIVFLLVERGNVYYSDEDGCKPIHRAAESGSLTIVQMLINQGSGIISVNTIDAKGYTPLHYASRRGDGGIIRLLLLEGAFPRARAFRTAETPLHLACQYGHRDSVLLLIGAGADINAMLDTAPKSSALHMATKANHGNIVQILCDARVMVNYQDEDRHSALHLAAGYMDGIIAGILIDGGAYVNLTDSLGMTALHIAVMNRNLTVVKLLINRPELDILKQETARGLTAFHYAAMTEPVIIEALLQKSVNWNELKTFNGQTLLHLAANSGKLAVVKFLLESGLDANFKDSYGHTPLHSAIVRGPNMVAVMRCLIMAGAIIDACDNQGHTPLHRYAFQCIVGHFAPDGLKELVSAGSHLGPVKSLNHKSALCWLTRYGRADLINYLVNAGWHIEEERSWINLQFGTAATNVILLYLRESLQQPWSLMQNCRNVLREHLSQCTGGREIISRAEQLTLPTVLIKYLLVET